MTMKETTLNIYYLDMWGNKHDGYELNDKHHLATLTMKGVVNKRKITKLLRETMIPASIGSNIKVPILSTKPKRIYIEDYYNDGSYFEIGMRYHHVPFLGVEVVEE